MQGQHSLYELTSKLSEDKSSSSIQQSTKDNQAESEAIEKVVVAINKLTKSMATAKQPKPQVETIGKELAEALNQSLAPLMRIMSGKLDLDLGTHQKMTDINDKLDKIEKQYKTAKKSTKKDK